MWIAITRGPPGVHIVSVVDPSSFPLLFCLRVDCVWVCLPPWSWWASVVKAVLMNNDCLALSFSFFSTNNKSRSPLNSPRSANYCFNGRVTPVCPAATILLTHTCGTRLRLGCPAKEGKMGCIAKEGKWAIWHICQQFCAPHPLPLLQARPCPPSSCSPYICTLPIMISSSPRTKCPAARPWPLRLPAAWLTGPGGL